MTKTTLTNLEGVFLVAGAGMGVGILTIPYAAAKIGYLGVLLAFALAVLANCFIYLMIAEMTKRSHPPVQMLEILQCHLFKGKWAKPLANLFFLILFTVLTINLIVYILCIADIALSFLPTLSPVIIKLIFYLLATSLIFYGIKAIGIGEKFSMILITLAVFSLVFLSLGHFQQNLSLTIGDPSGLVVVYSIFMLAFTTIFSIIQVTSYLEKQADLKKVVLGGLALNATITLIFTTVVLLCSQEITPVATIGLAAALPYSWIPILMAIFVVLAVLTSYWSIGLAAKDIVQAQFKLAPRASWIASTLPALLAAAFLPLTILNYMQLGAGAFSLILILMIIPAYFQAVKKGQPPFILGRWAKSKSLLLLVTLSMLVMAAASFIQIE